jgi:1-acyl-sn-glycerol-3-phosphate acyltransferase
MVARMRAAREQGEFLWLVLAPEGTRAAGPGWRSGFYRVAVEAGCRWPWRNWTSAAGASVFIPACELSGNLEADMAEIARRYSVRAGPPRSGAGGTDPHEARSP